jgi:hypothetical protein
MMFFTYSLITVLLSFHLGCGSDPILDKASQLQTKSSKRVNNSSSNIKPGVPNEPKPVQVKPKPVQVKPKQVKPKKDPKPQVVLSGRVEIIGEGDWKEKPIRIDVFDGDQRSIDGPRPKVVSTKRMPQQGSFSLSVDKKDQSLWLGAYCDVDGDGRPGPNDPSGWFAKNPLSSDQDHAEIVILLAIPVEEEKPQEDQQSK